MMAHPDFDTMLVLARRQNDLAAAEQSRLIKIALEAENEHNVARKGFHPGILFEMVLNLAGQGLTQLGLRFQDWGWQLQMRYAMGGRGGSSMPCK